MPRLEDARSKILKSAQFFVQNRGFGGFSFRDIADEIGIKSASIHYHFPTKDELIIELARNYREEFFRQLDELTHDVTEAGQRIKILVEAFQAVLIEDDRMCLCGMLAADAEFLSDQARREVTRFYNDCVSWLSTQWTKLGKKNAHDMAIDTFVRLEGAMLIARVSGSTEPFEVVKKAIMNSIGSTGD